jgi:hypothetical protein
MIANAEADDNTPAGAQVFASLLCPGYHCPKKKTASDSCSLHHYCFALEEACDASS